MTSGDAAERQVLHLMRVTIEALSPLSLGSGDVAERTDIIRDERGDSGPGTSPTEIALVRDANGLPTIPGSTLQGILRHLYDAEYADPAQLFGYAGDDSGQAGRLIVGFAAVHGERDCAVTGLVTSADTIAEDPLLTLLRRPSPLRRDHVALNERHVADGHKKFTRLAVPVGTRFSVEVALWGSADALERDQAQLRHIAILFDHPGLRVGGGGGRGYGRVKVVRASYECLRLSDPASLRTRRRQPPSTPLAIAWGTAGAGIFSQTVTATITLAPLNPWRVGGAGKALTEGTYGIRYADGSEPRWAECGSDRRGADSAASENVATFIQEPRIVWHGDVGRVFQPTQKTPSPLAIPGSAIKGPIVHRTLFHWKRTQPDGEGMIDADKYLLELDEANRQKRLAGLAKRPAELDALLGTAKERDERDSTGPVIRGRAARVLIEDAIVTDIVAIQAVDHNSLDRFTGGVREGALYAEEVLVGGRIEFVLSILPPLAGEGEGSGVVPDWDQATKQALVATLRDLCEGRLAIGAKSLGFCRGAIEWGGSKNRRAGWEEAWRRSAIFDEGSR